MRTTRIVWRFLFAAVPCACSSGGGASFALAGASGDFGSIPLGSASDQQQIEIANVGSAPSGPLHVDVQGAAGFDVVSDACSGQSVGARQKCVAVVRFRPRALGPQSAELIAGDGAARVTLSLRGVGMDSSALVFTPSSRDFGQVQVQQSAPQAFDLANSGTAATGPVSISISGEPSDFAIDGDGCSGSVLGPGAHCSATVRFAPSSAGSRLASLLASASPGGSATAALSGQGMPVGLAFDVSEYDFGLIDSTHPPLPKTFTVKNLARTPSGAVAIAIDPADGTLLVSSGCSAPLDAAATCPVTITPATLSAGRNTATVTATATPGGQAKVTVAATGSLAEALLSLKARSLGGGAGGITSDPPGIECTTVPCDAPDVRLPAGTHVTLSATPETGSLLRWMGPCLGSGNECSFDLTRTTRLEVDFSATNYVFVTAGTYDPSAFGGLDGADAVCQAEAAAAGLPGHYVAWLSTNAAPAVSRIRSSRGWMRVDGLPFADTAASLTVYNQIFHPIRLAPNGRDEAYLYVTTGTSPDGYAAFNCNDWQGGPGAFVSFGSPTAGPFEWTEAVEGTSCGGYAYPIYCFGVDLSRVVSPAAASGRLAFVSVGTMKGNGGVRGADALCASEAANAQLPGTYKAFIATTGASAASRFDGGGLPWVRTDGIPVVAAATDLFVGRLLAPIAIHADGTTTVPFDPEVWTGSIDPRQPAVAATDCANWTTSEIGSAQGQTGSASETNPTLFMRERLLACNFDWPVYCLQE